MLTLQAGSSSLVLAPEIGGSIVGWSHGVAPLLRRPHPDAIMTGNARGLGCFPLVPFSNRIAYGRFRWDGIDYALDRNFGDHPHTIHGVGWQRAWQVSDVSAASATLTLQHDADRNWPFAFEAEQQFTLDEGALRVALSIRNRHVASAPAGLGLHPYFPRAGSAHLAFHAAQVWLNGAEAVPTEPTTIPPNWEHAAGRSIGDAALDNCFAGWDGAARITWKETGTILAIEADEPFRHLIVYTPRSHDYFCVEPVSHVNDAINRMTGPGHGLRTLAPGATLIGTITFQFWPADEPHINLAMLSFVANSTHSLTTGSARKGPECWTAAREPLRVVADQQCR